MTAIAARDVRALLHRLIRWLLDLARGPQRPVYCEHGFRFEACRRHRRYGGGWPF